MGDVEVVEKRSPDRVVVEDDVGESDQGAAVLGHDRAAPRIRSLEPAGPHRQTVGADVAVQERVGVGAAVVPAPAVGVKRRDRGRVPRAGEAELQI